MLEVKPLSKTLADRAKALGVLSIEIRFSGGSDEGYCSVALNTEDSSHSTYSYGEASSPLNVLAGEIEDWALEVYDYCGAGDGSDYGDDITYDFESNVVEVSEWYMQRVDGDSQEVKLAIEGDQSDDESQKNQEASNN